MSAEYLTFTWFYYKSIYILLKQFLQIFRFHCSGVPGIFQNYAVSIFRHNPIYTLNNSWENIICEICSDYSYVVCFPCVWQHLTAICSTPMFSIHKPLFLKNLKSLSHCLPTDTILFCQFIFRRKLISWPDISTKNLGPKLLHQIIIL